MDCASVIMTPPATILGSAPGTPCESLDLVDCPTGLLTSSQAHDFLTSGASNLVYENVYCENNKVNQSLLYSSGCDNISNNVALTSFLASPIENDNSEDPI